ncbi:MAG: 2Fe-2S iron-sulfur cluster-binding protein, partial [Alphaproteobacteria bacterium]
MTSSSLLLIIGGVVLVQLAIYLGFAYWGHWRSYLALRRRGDDGAFEPASATDTPAAAPVWQGGRPFRVARKVIENAKGTVCSFYLVPEDGRPLPPYRPGQFLTFNLDIPSAEGANAQVIRCYTLSDAPAKDAYRISVKREADGTSSNYLHNHIGVGDVLQVRAPSGHFHLDDGQDPVVLIGGGIGITPMLSMLNWALANQPKREIWLFYGVRNGTEAIMLAHLEEMAAKHPNFHLRICYSAPMADDMNGQAIRIRGRVDITLLRVQLPLKPFHFYICGPSAMLESLVPDLEDWGVPPAHIYFEAFGPASVKRRQVSLEDAPATPDGEEVLITFARSEKQILWKPNAGSLLDFAEANGISVNSGCRAGGCGTCQTAIKAGEVTYRQAPDYDPEPGTCLMCVCA